LSEVSKKQGRMSTSTNGYPILSKWRYASSKDWNAPPTGGGQV